MCLISQSTKILLKMGCQYHHRDWYCDITLCLAIKIELQLRPISTLCELANRLYFQGDVQMAVSALIVLGDRIQDKISMELQEQWYMSYIGEFLKGSGHYW